MLGWSINLFRVFGIQLTLHVSFLLLVAYVGYDGWMEGGFPGMGWSVSLIVSFFICVILHELGHSLTARRYGVRVPRILLMPIGGMAEFDRIPRKPSQELLITLAGPAVNFAIGGVILAFTWRRAGVAAELSEYSARSLIDELWRWNLWMGVFNLLPVFPMDGGRIFRALLAFRLPYLRATYWAVTVGKVLALCFALIAGFYFEKLMLCALFLFILWAGDAEYRQTLRREEEARYWAEISRRITSLETGDAEPPGPPPLILHGPN